MRTVLSSKASLWGALLTFVIISEVCGQSPLYDWSTPEQCLASLRLAYNTRDESAISDHTYGWKEVATSPAAAEEFRELFGKCLDQLTVRHVDRNVFDVLQNKFKSGMFDDVARVVCTYENRTHNRRPEQNHVCAIYLIHESSKWQWYMDPYRFFDFWSYDLTSPDAACASISIAIKRKDPVGVYEMIEPGLRDGVDRQAFTRTAMQRFESIRNWEESHRMEAQKAKSEHRRVPKQSLPPFRPMGFFSSSEEERKVEFSQIDGRQLATVWQLSPQNDRKSSEAFVTHEGRWYWRPRPEYDVWVLKPAVTTSTAP